MLRTKVAFLAAGSALVLASGAFAQQTTTTSEVKEAEIIYVHGNTVVFAMDGQVMEREVSPDFRVKVDGNDVPVSALEPGQKVRLERTTTTKVYPATRVTK